MLDPVPNENDAFADVAAFAQLVRSRSPGSAADTAAMISELARESGLRARRVRLRRDQWWRANLGPLIAHNAEEVVALVPAVGSYTLLASDGQRRKVDATLAQEIDVEAWTLHAPLLTSASPATLAVLPAPSRRGTQQIVGILVLAAFIAANATVACLAWAQVVQGKSSALAVLLVTAVCLVAAYAVAAVSALRMHGESCRNAGPRLWDRVLRLRGSWLRAQDLVAVAGALRRADSVAKGVAGKTRAFVATAMLAGALIAATLLMGASAAGLAALGGVLVVGLAAIGSGIDESDARMSELDTRSGALVADALEAFATLRTLSLLDELRARESDLSSQRQQRAHKRGILRAAHELVLLAGAMMAAIIAIGLSLNDEVSAPLLSAGLVWFASLELAGAARGWRAACKAQARLTPLFAAPIEPAVASGREVSVAKELTVRGLAYARPGAARPLLVDVDLKVAAGDVVAIQGASGIGKSTLLRLILGLETLDAGEVLWSGVPLAALNPVALRARVGVVLQDQRPPAASLRAILAGPSQLDEESAWALACEVGLANELNMLPMGLETLVGIGTLSPAAEQRLLVGRALANAPDFLILDETLSALDPVAQQDLLKALRRRGVTCLLLGHGEILAACADRAYILADGRLRLQPTAARATSQAHAADLRSAPLPPPTTPAIQFREAARHRLTTPLRNDDPAPVLTPLLLASTLRRIAEGAFRFQDRTARSRRTTAQTGTKEES